MISDMKGEPPKPVISPSNPVRDDLALLSLIRLAAGPVEPFHSLYYSQITGKNPNEKKDMVDIARHNNTIARWWAQEKLRLTDVNDEGGNDESEGSWDGLLHSFEILARRVSPAPNIRNPNSPRPPLKSCLKASTTTYQSASTFSLVSSDSSPTAKQSGRRVVFNEIVLESIIADAPMIIPGVRQDLGTANIKEHPGLGKKRVHVPIHSVIGLDPGQENRSILNHSSTSLISPLIGVAPPTIKAIIPLSPVTLYPPPRQEEIGVTIKFVPPSGMSSLQVEDLLPSDRALRAAADAELTKAIEKLYERHGREFMVGSVGDIARGGGYVVDGELGMVMKRRSGRGKQKKEPLGSNSGQVKPESSAAGGQRASIRREPTVRTYISYGPKMAPSKGYANHKAGTEKENAGKGGVSDEALVKHEAGRGIVAKVVRLTKGWIWRSG